MAAAPLVSLVVVPLAFARRTAAPGARRAAGATTTSTWRRGGRFALAVLGVMLAEQTLINGAVLTVDATAADAAVAGFVFNVLLIARAPLQLFQAIQGSLLPHLAGPAGDRGPRGVPQRDPHHACSRSRRSRARSRSGCCIIGPWAMGVLFDDDYDYGRGGLAIVALGMGCHLAAGTLNQAALARGQTAHAAMAGSPAPRCSWAGCSRRSSTTSSCGPRSGYFGAAAPAVGGAGRSLAPPRRCSASPLKGSPVAPPLCGDRVRPRRRPMRSRMDRDAPRDRACADDDEYDPLNGPT